MEADSMEEVYQPPEVPDCKGKRCYLVDDNGYEDDIHNYHRMQVCLTDEALQKFMDDQSGTLTAYEVVVVRRIKLKPEPRKFTIVEA